jgi:hypothetical protein
MKKQAIIILVVLFFLNACTPEQGDKSQETSLQTGIATTTNPPTPSKPTLLLSTPDLSKAAQEEAMLYQQDFESGSSDGLWDWVIGNWNFVKEDTGNHMYCNEISNEDLLFQLGAYEWKDYAFELRVKPVERHSDPNINLYARFDRQKWFMYFGALNLVTLRADLAFNEPYTPLGDKKIQGASDNWYTLRLELAGSKIKYYVNDTLVGSGVDTHRSEGKAGILISRNLKVCIDDIRVWELTPNGQIAKKPENNNFAVLSVAERLASHRFPKLFYQNQREESENMAPAYYWDILTFDKNIAKSNWIYLGPTGIIRSKNPNAVILATHSVQEFFPSDSSITGKDFVSSLKPEWIMRDIHGNPFPSFCCYNGEWSIMMNLSTDVNTFIPNFLSDKSMKTGLFDGIFYDGTNETWYNRSGLPIDINNDGKKDSQENVDIAMDQGLIKLIKETRKVFPQGSLVTGNGIWRGMESKTSEKSDTILADLLNGRMIEGFLNWDDRGRDWQLSMRTYYFMQQVSVEPKTPFIMAYCTGTDYDHLRYTLASTLMFDGYFTCTNTQEGPLAEAYHAFWWYDEYSVDLASGKAIQSLDAKGYLGLPINEAYNPEDNSELLSTLLVNNDSRARKSTWRRDFQNGIVLVNPSNTAQTIDLNGIYRKISGSYDPVFNDGATVSKITLKPKSGIILLNIP